MTQNVVMYTVEVNTENADKTLLPYLTANVQFEVRSLKNVLTVPNVALRWIPLPQMVAPEAREAAPLKPPRTTSTTCNPVRSRPPPHAAPGGIGPP